MRSRERGIEYGKPTDFTLYYNLTGDISLRLLNNRGPVELKQELISLEKKVDESCSGLSFSSLGASKLVPNVWTIFY